MSKKLVAFQMLLTYNSQYRSTESIVDGIAGNCNSVAFGKP